MDARPWWILPLIKLRLPLIPVRAGVESHKFAAFLFLGGPSAQINLKAGCTTCTSRCTTSAVILRSHGGGCRGQ